MPSKDLSSRQVPPDFAKRILEVRGKLGLTQMGFAERLGVSHISVCRWEKGKAKPGFSVWKQVVKLEEEAFGGSGPSNQDLFPVLRQEVIAGGALNFGCRPDVVASVVEAERLGFGHLANPGFAAELSLIDPLPHQRIAVYDVMLKQPRLRFLLADDAGAGKTIMAGLYIREMLSRRLIRRVLVVSPAGLVGNWLREMRRLFNLPFRVAMGADVRTGNPFVGEDGGLVIVSVDTLTGEKMLSRIGAPEVAPYDLVIFDEAHKLAARRNPDGTISKTDRYRLAEALCGTGSDDAIALPWQAQHVLLLTATPHMGVDYPYFALWRLLEPNVLATPEAFESYPDDARRGNFIRRTKEEMVTFEGLPLYPVRESQTWNFDLNPAEDEVYKATTHYMRAVYNKARILNRSAARLAMSVFQRRLASSSYALMRSFERRVQKLDELIRQIESGELSAEELANQQRKLESSRGFRDVFELATADEEEAENGVEENERGENTLLAGVVATSLAELEEERGQVETLRRAAQALYESGEESKFNRMLESFRDPQFAAEKFLIFTEHRDTLEYIVTRLRGLGYQDQVASIHGGMDYREREQQLDFFRRRTSEGGLPAEASAQAGARYMVCTDAAGEGLNMQFCRLMINYDIPWNPARIEQRFGRIHRYGQKAKLVLLFNLVASKTREGKVLKRLLEKLEAIRKALTSDKVFDVIGAQFEGMSLRDLMIRAVGEDNADELAEQIDRGLTKEKARETIRTVERRYPRTGDVATHLVEQRLQLEKEDLRRLLPGYVRRFLEKACPLMALRLDGDLDATFKIAGQQRGATDWLLPMLETYPEEARGAFTVLKPKEGEAAVFLHPGERIFDRLCALIEARFQQVALAGSVFSDPWADAPYFVHVARARISAECRVQNGELPSPLTPLPSDGRGEPRRPLECRLVAVKQPLTGVCVEMALEQLLLLRGVETGPGAFDFARQQGPMAVERATKWLKAELLEPQVEGRRKELRATLPQRLDFLQRGFAYHEAELAIERSRRAEKAREGDPRARHLLERVKERQRNLAAQRERACAELMVEPDMVRAEDPVFIAHALVVPSTDPEERKRHDREVEKIAMLKAIGFEEEHGRLVVDVSAPEKAVMQGLEAWPGFDLLSRHANGQEGNGEGARPDARHGTQGPIAIEVKGRAGVGEIEVSDNEWAKACNLRERYWLYVVFNCAGPHPELHRIQDPFGKLIARAKGGVVLDAASVLQAAER
jgi:superfamily II DNA or RNA helicase/DNA-binding XRE family transcriptional regulator